MSNVMALALLLLGAMTVSAGPVARHHVAQLDLARQMETTTFVSNWLTHVASLGYDCVRLYLEARVATRTFSLPEGERYTSDEMKAIVRHADSVGIEIIPSLQFYGHAEQFFLYPGQEELSEESCGRYRDDPRKSTFCYANPKTRAFISSYIDDLADIFPAKRWIVDFESDVFPDALRVSYTGYGQGAVSYVAIEDRERRVCPQSVLKTFGNVTGAQALLTDDLSVTTFGAEGFVKQFADQRLANAASGVEIELAKYLNALKMKDFTQVPRTTKESEKQQQGEWK